MPRRFTLGFQRSTHGPGRARSSRKIRGAFATGGDSVRSADVSRDTIRRGLGPGIAFQFARLYCKAYDEGLHDVATPGGPRNAIDDRTVALAKQFIPGPLAAPSPVSATAPMGNMTERGFSRGFPRATGQTPSAYMRRGRMDPARALRRESRVPIEEIEEIAACLDYGDRAAFAKSFRRVAGHNPAAYRPKFQAPSQFR